MAKCGVCGKFLSNNVSVRCCKCQGAYHKDCANLDATGAKGWACPGCKTKINREATLVTPNKSQDFNSSPAVSPNVAFVDALAPGNTQESIPELVREIRYFRQELSELRAEVREYRNEIFDFKTELISQGDSITKMESRISSLEKEFDSKIPADLDPIRDTIAELKCQLNERDQELLLNDVEIAGIPETKNESMIHLTQVISNTLGITLDERDIVHAERVGSVRRNRVQGAVGRENTSAAADTTQQPRQISVRFSRRIIRDQLLRAARVRRGLDTTNLNLPGSPCRVYVNERLTRMNRHLFYQARQAGSNHSWKYVWTREGKILARKGDGQKAELIRSQDDICKIFG